MTLSGIENIMQALGWTLLHSIWQISVLALIFYCLISFLPQDKPEVRYGIGVLSLLLTAILSAGTFIEVYDSEWSDAFPIAQQEARETPFLEIYDQHELIIESSEPTSYWFQMLELSQAWIDQRINWLVGAWLSGILLLSVRFGGSLFYLERLKTRSVAPLPLCWQNKMQDMANVLMISRSIQLLSSGLAHTPLMIGHLKPVILIPASMLSGLSDEQLEAIIAHELAHIYRRDYWVNIMQSVLEIIFFFHPAIWWISSVIRAEREKCCDDLAVSLCGDSLAYAKALARVEEIKVGQPTFALAFGGKRGGLFHRIERILQPGKKTQNLRARFVSVSLVMLSLLFVLTTSESQALRYGGEKAREALNWVRTSYLPENVESRLPAAIYFQQEREHQEKRPESMSSLVLSEKDTLPKQPATPQAAPQVFSYRYQVFGDSNQAPMVISIPDLPDLEHIKMIDFQDFDSIFQALDQSMDSLPGFVFNYVQDSSFVFLSGSPGAPATAAFSFSMNDSLLSKTIQRAMVVADSAIKSPAFSQALAAPYFLNDTTLEAKLRKLEQEMLKKEREMEALIREREQEMEMLLRERENELRQKEQELVQQMIQKEKQFEQQMQEQQKQMQQELRRQEQQMEQAQQKLQEEQQRLVDKRAAMDKSILKLEALLLADKLIEKGERYNIRIRPEQIQVNGDQLSDKLFIKYRKFMEEEEIFSFEDGDTISITRVAQ